MNINWAAPTIDIFSWDYPPIINIFRLPSEPSSLDLYHALTPIVLGCCSAYGMHDACMPLPIQSNHMQIYKHKYIHIKIKSHNMLCIYPFNIKISSLGLIYKHKQFDSNYLIKHIFSQKYVFGSLFLGTVKP